MWIVIGFVFPGFKKVLQPLQKVLQFAEKATIA